MKQKKEEYFKFQSPVQHLKSVWRRCSFIAKLCSNIATDIISTQKFNLDATNKTNDYFNYVFNELLENVAKYALYEEDNPFKICLFLKENNYFAIEVINDISKENTKKIIDFKSKVENNKNSLDDVYQERLLQNSMSIDNNESNLGLLSIVAHYDVDIEFDIQTHKDYDNITVHAIFKKVKLQES